LKEKKSAFFIERLKAIKELKSTCLCSRLVIVQRVVACTRGTETAFDKPVRHLSRRRRRSTSLSCGGLERGRSHRDKVSSSRTACPVPRDGCLERRNYRSVQTFTRGDTIYNVWAAKSTKCSRKEKKNACSINIKGLLYVRFVTGGLVCM